MSLEPREQGGPRYGVKWVRVRLWPGFVFILRESEGTEEVKLMGRVGEAVCSDQKPHSSCHMGFTEGCRLGDRSSGPGKN